MKSANPYVYFPGNTEEAFGFYKAVFGCDFMGMLRYRDFGENVMGVPKSAMDKIAHTALPLGGGNLLMATDAVDPKASLTIGNNFYIALEADTAEEADRVFNALSADGVVEMPLSQVEWAEKYGICKDRFGIQWMMTYTGSVTFQVPGNHAVGETGSHGAAE